MDKFILAPLQEIVIAALGTKGYAYQEGGDEISLLLPNMTEGMAIEFARALRSAVQAKTFLVNETDNIQVKLSIGIAHVTSDMPRDGLFQHANDAELHSKHTGKGKTCVYRSDGFTDVTE